ncbi:MAG: GNAT family N-acetyltransferase [Proteobacteria bacterium]|nr:MAG: GNAT family N-acetyltransferase [Pseudomonadota bacterium]
MSIRGHLYNRAVKPTFEVRRALWPQDAEPLRAVREAVFVREQSVPIELEWDGMDGECLHVLAIDQAGRPIGTGRLLPDGHIGRMAVLPQWRHRGVGGAILKELIEAARERSLAEIVLNAQTHAQGFYARFGFVSEGAEFLDAGIPHRTMRRPVTASVG